jgi:hypothetical protein
MVAIVIRRRFKPLVYVLAAAQLLLAVPAMTAAQEETAASIESASSHCADALPDAHPVAPDEPSSSETACPCCPDGITTMAGCASVCATAVGATPTLPISVTRAATAHASGAAFLPAPAAADPPPNPPPIA